MSSSDHRGNEDASSSAAQAREFLRNHGSASNDAGPELKQSDEVREVRVSSTTNKSLSKDDVKRSSTTGKKQAVEEWRRKSMERDSSADPKATSSAQLNSSLNIPLGMSKSVDLNHLKFKLAPSKQNLYREFLQSSDDLTMTGGSDGPSSSSRPSTARTSYEDIKIKRLTEKTIGFIKSADNMLKSVSKIDPDAKASDKEWKYLLYEEAEECTFKPKLHAYSNSENKSTGDKSKPKDIRIKEWLASVETKERTRRTMMEKEIGERDYKAMNNKKWCPICQKTQTYDEYAADKKKCSECKVSFRYKTVVDYDKLKIFFAKQSKLYEKSQLALDETRKEVIFNERASEVKVFDAELKKTVTLKKNLMDTKIVWNEEKKSELTERLLEDQARREEELKKIEDEVYEKYTFRPHISSLKKTEDNEDSQAAFLERLDAAVEKRKERGLVKQKVEVKKGSRFVFGNYNAKQKAKKIDSERNDDN